jgi:transcription elongation GreA/GreB family factor
VSRTTAKAQRVDKKLLRAALVESLTRALEVARAAHSAATEGATHGEARAENSKDTRGLEQSYVARGQAQRVAELESAINTAASLQVENFATEAAVRLCSLVTVASDDAKTSYWLLPVGGGSILHGVVAITPSSPVGRALLGRNVGDVVNVQGRDVELEIIDSC